MPPLATKSKSCKIFKSYSLTSAPPLEHLTEVWTTPRWTYSPSWVTAWRPKLKILHFIYTMYKRIGITDKRTDRRTDGWSDYKMTLADLSSQGHKNIYFHLSLRGEPLVRTRRTKLVLKSCLQRSHLHNFTFLGNICLKKSFAPLVQYSHSS